MSEPVAYVSTWRIKEGKFEDYERFYAELVNIVDENEPRLTAFLTFANEDSTEITNVHLFPDSGALTITCRSWARRCGCCPMISAK